MWLWITLAACPYISDQQQADRIAAFRLSGAVEIDEADVVVGAPAGLYGFGASLAAAELGPVDTDEGADSKADLIVGAPGLFGDAPVAGAVVVLERIAPGNSIATAAPTTTWFVGEADDGTGWSVAAIHDDIVIGAPFHGGDMPQDLGPGMVYQVGYATMRASPTFILPATDAGGSVRGVLKSAAGFAVAVYDADGDAVDDVLASAPFAGVIGGRVVLYSAGLGLRLDPLPDANIEGPVSLGTSLADGDFDGDGIGDLVAGAAYAGGTGAVYVLLGPIDGDLSTDDAWATLTSPGSDRLGADVDADDLDGDGLDDLVVSAPEATPGDIATGALWWIRGSDLADGDPAQLSAGSLRGQAADDLCCAVSVGDVDQDEVGDMLVGAPGHNGGAGMAALFYGPIEGAADLSQAPFTVVGQNRSGATGYAVLLADVAGDDHLDLIIGAPLESLVGEDFGGAIGLFFGVGR